MESTDKDLGRLKTLCRGLFFVLLILTVLVAMVICILVSGVAIEVLEPGTVSDEVGRNKMLATLALKRNVEAALCSDQEAIWTGEEKGNKFR